MKWSEYNPNPTGRRVGDCAVRAVAKALGISWHEAFKELVAQALIEGDMPSADAVWGNVLARNGFRRYIVPNSCPNCYTAADFAADHPQGVFVLGFGGHTAAVVDGVLYDSWDSSSLVPQYYWYRRH